MSQKQNPYKLTEIYGMQNAERGGDTQKERVFDEDENPLGDLDFIKLIIVARKNFLWVFLLIFLGASSAYFYNRYTYPVYESSSIIKFDVKSQSEVLGIKNVFSSSSDNEMENLSGEIELLKSNLIYEKALTLLEFNVFYYAKGNLKNEERYRSSPFRVVYDVKKFSYFDNQIHLYFKDNDNVLISYLDNNGEEKEFDVKVGVTAELPIGDLTIMLSSGGIEQLTGDYFFKINSYPAQLAYLSSGLTVDVLNVSAKTIRISFKDNTPSKAQDVVRAIDSVYLESSLEKKYQAQTQAIMFLENQLNDTEKQLESFETKLENFSIQNKTIDIKANFSKTLTQIADLEKENLRLQHELRGIEQLQSSIEGDGDISLVLPSVSESMDNQVVKLADELTKLQMEKRKLTGAVNENTLVLRAKNAEYKKQLTILGDLLIESKKNLLMQYGNNKKSIEALEKDFLNMPSKETSLKRIQRFYNLYEKLYLMLIDKKAEMAMAKASTVPEFTILSQPSLPTVPIFPVKFNVYLTGVGVGFFLSFILIFVRYFLMNTINNIGEVKKLTPAPILGYVPEYETEKLEVSKLVIDLNPKSSISESLRSIRTNLDFLNHKKQGPYIITVTSTVSGEGKTFVSLNLAGVIAISGVKTIILDLDMRKPKINKSFDCVNDKGCSTILSGKHSVEECIHQTRIPTLDFITAGQIPPNPSELILRKEFYEMIAKLKEIYDVIVIDTPPVGLVTDGTIIMRAADIPIYVLRAEYSRKGYEKNINDLIRNYGYRNLSVILNGFKTIKGYGYGFKYGYYAKSYGYYSEGEKVSLKDKVKNFVKGL